MGGAYARTHGNTSLTIKLTLGNAAALSLFCFDNLNMSLGENACAPLQSPATNLAIVSTAVTATKTAPIR